ncbi:keratin, type I cytoskeletal 19-like [Bombina bombina]|uniref:keratin, type I cytoskeletal 19-like n=1 Tax=Bombina bombina TaxID=8345 RepID=UPI00235AD79F|nr:keratin, type I cytoskeletal 19-like [Bombina bombina]
MSHSIQQTHSASSKGNCHDSGCAPKISHNIPSQHAASHVSHQRVFHKVPSEGHYRSPSVHGGSGGKGVCLSQHYTLGYGHDQRSYFGTFEGHGWNNNNLFCINEKETMQLLNDRLASYLEEVCLLEQENNQLERNIREWYEIYQPNTFPDYSNYLKTIKDFQGEIIALTGDSAKIFLQIDNAKMAADDFRNKFEIEQSFRNIVEADLAALKRVLESLNIETCSLERQVQDLQEELQQMKRNHEEEVNGLRTQLGARVSVEVDAAPSIDLKKALSDIRKEYENLMERNLREVENIFLARSEELNREMVSGAEQLQTTSSELTELRRTIQNLEIELQCQLSTKSALEDTLSESEATFGFQLAQLQNLINNVESQLTQIRSDLERLNYDYKILVDQKTHLEIEIATYKRLLDGHDTHSQIQEYHCKGSHKNVRFHQVTEHVQQTKC